MADLPDPTASAVFHRHLHRTPPVAVSGDGCWLTDNQGKRYLDASGGAAVSCVGHGHPDVLAAMHQQLDQLAYAHTSFCTAPGCYRASGHESCLLRQRRLRGDGSCDEDGAPILRRDWPAATHAVHRAAAELSRQHAWRTGCRWQSVAARAVRATADSGDACRAVLSLPRAACRRVGARLWNSACERTR